MLKIWALVVSMVFWALPLSAWAAPLNPDLANSQLIINLPRRTIELYSGNQLVKAYPVAIGKPSTPTPIGTFHIYNKEINPAWFPPDEPGKVIPSGPYNPLGYRWMGFLPTYGVHGTNNPDSIGGVVSNGCVRMHESDVEELYEMVSVHTPLKIAYERVDVGMDKDNRAYIAIYPDVYGRQEVTVQTVRDRLKPHGWNEWIDDSTITQLIDASDEKPYVFLQFYHLKLNGKHLTEKVQIRQNKLLAPLLSIAERVNAKVVYDNQSGHAKVGSQSFPAETKGNKVFATPESINVLFGGRHQINHSTNCLEAEVLTLTLNNKPVTGDFPILGEIPLLPVLTVTQATGQKVFWDEKTGTLIASGKVVPAKVIRGKPYIPINRVYEFFQAYVYWDEAARNIDLTFPFHEPDGD